MTHIRIFDPQPLHAKQSCTCALCRAANAQCTADHGGHMKHTDHWYEIRIAELTDMVEGTQTLLRGYQKALSESQWKVRHLGAEIAAVRETVAKQRANTYRCSFGSRCTCPGHNPDGPSYGRVVPTPRPAQTKPVPLILLCPQCCERHVDADASPPHRTHACRHCGFLWAPGVVETVGVQFLPGCQNSPAYRSPSGNDLCVCMHARDYHISGGPCLRSTCPCARYVQLGR